MLRLVKVITFLACFALAAGSVPAFTLGINSSSNHNAWYGGQFWNYIQVYDFYEQGNNGSPYGYWLNSGEVLNWTHTHDLNVPPDIVTQAYLKIEALYVDTWNNEVAIEGTAEWNNLTKDWQFWFWRGNIGSYYDLSALPQSDWADGKLAVSVSAGERLRIDKSTLVMRTKPSTPLTAVPEPATMLLFGFGIIGSGIYRRLKK